MKKPTKRQQEYWDQILHDHRLSEGRGRKEKEVSVGGNDELRISEERLVARKTGRVRPPGHGPDN